MSFTVGQLAKLTGLTVRALHHYHAIGLLELSQRSESGYRLYTARCETLRGGTRAREGAGLPMFVARAGLDQPLINQSIDTFVQEALAGNAPLELINHPAGRHGFDILDDDERSREIIARAVAFAQVHVRRSDR
jgi:DNA-binding transcriptional MerR regulator